MKMDWRRASNVQVIKIAMKKEKTELNVVLCDAGQIDNVIAHLLRLLASIYFCIVRR